MVQVPVIIIGRVPAIRGTAIMGFRGIFSSQKSVLDVHVPLVLVWYRYSYRVVHSTGTQEFIDLLNIECRAKEKSDFDENDIFDRFRSRRIFGFCD